jgi:hypothetical protein
MHSSLQLVERFEELLSRQHDELPYDYPTMFPADGAWTRRASQKKLAFLKKIDEALRATLRPGEHIVFLTQAIAHSFWESYFFGWAMYYMNRRAIALTTQRVLLLQIDARRRPRELRSQVELGAVDRFSRTAFGNTILHVTSGAKYVFIRVSRRDRKALVDLTVATKAKAAAPPGKGDLQHLCPHCFQAVEAHPVECPACKGALKSWRKAGLLSFLFPGLGDIYLGHRGIAAFEILLAGFIWFSLIMEVVSPAPDSPPVAPGELAVTIPMLFLILHGMDAIGTSFIAKKGHYPASS